MQHNHINHINRILDGSDILWKDGSVGQQVPSLQLHLICKGLAPDLGSHWSISSWNDVKIIPKLRGQSFSRLLFHPLQSLRHVFRSPSTKLVSGSQLHTSVGIFCHKRSFEPKAPRRHKINAPCLWLEGFMPTWPIVIVNKTINKFMKTPLHSVKSEKHEKLWLRSVSKTKNNCLLPCRWLDAGLPWERVWELSPLAQEVKGNSNSFFPFLLLQCFFAISAWVNLTSSIQHRCLSDTVILQGKWKETTWDKTSQAENEAGRKQEYT